MMNELARQSRGFSLGFLVVSVTAMNLCASAVINPFEYLQRHQRGDWGDLSDRAKYLNNIASNVGDMVHSSYAIGQGRTLWIITRPDLKRTVMMLSSDFVRESEWFRWAMRPAEKTKEAAPCA